MSTQHAAEILSRPADSRRKLLFWGALLVGAHFIAVLWHLDLLFAVQPSFPRIAGLMLVLGNLLPIVGVVGFAKGANRFAATLIVIPLGVALVIGGYSHFLSPGSDNVLRMPSGGLTLPFQISALLLALLEVFGCLVGVTMLSRRYS